MSFIITDAPELEPLLEEQGLEHEDLDRLAEYIALVGNYYGEKTREEVLADNLAKWMEWESETYYGQHDSPVSLSGPKATTLTTRSSPYRADLQADCGVTLVSSTPASSTNLRMVAGSDEP